MTRKRTHSGSAQQFAPARADMDHALYTRIERLADNARDNAPYPRYLESFRKNSLAGSTPVLTERQREKVVKYINEVRRCSLLPSPPCPQQFSTTTPLRHLLMCAIFALARLQLAEDFELSVQTGGLACNYFDRYMASVRAPRARSRTLPAAGRKVPSVSSWGGGARTPRGSCWRLLGRQHCPPRPRSARAHAPPHAASLLRIHRAPRSPPIRLSPRTSLNRLRASRQLPLKGSATSR